MSILQAPGAHPASSSAPLRPDIRWDVVGEHLDEAAFLWTQWELALGSPDFVLAEVAGGEEWRLRAHLEGLALAAPAAIPRLLVPALQSEERGRLCAAGQVLLGLGAPEADRAVWELLVEGPEETTEALLRAAGLSQRAGLTQELAGRLSQLKPESRPAALDCLASLGHVPPALLQGSGLDEAPAELAAALRAARFMDRAVAVPLVQRGLRESGAVLDAALRTGLVLGLRDAWLRCRQLTAEGTPEGGLSLVALATGGEASDWEVLIRALSSPELRDAAVWALGFSGQRVAAEALLGVLRNGGGALAAEAFAAITGMPPDVGAPPPAGEDEDGGTLPEVPARTGSFPPPTMAPGEWQAGAVEAWWSKARSRFEPGRRYLRGAPWTPEATLKALMSEPMHRRAVLAWELAVRTRGAFHLDTRGWAYQQARRLAAQRLVASEAVSRSFSSFITH
ncbi:TIGR02270 family protein [Corallococcus sicarius]|uniref:TIGR02270 family protein n=1 Tax=Corallococcus sicarius TaxID=2316726 RepID=A0A3A8NJY8_9BACT|nr:TIGR02270 family protein [Corallococcus sicarius]RKH40282.1 TIGR02270 family protein [Corallococcus sicarius]